MSMGNIPTQPALVDYDKEFQMYREHPDIDWKRLGFNRWLVQQGRLEHLPAGEPSGDMVEPFLENVPVRT